MVQRGPLPFTKPTRFQPGGVSWFQPAPPYRDVVDIDEVVVRPRGEQRAVWRVLDVTAQVEFESKVTRRYIML